MGTFCCLGPRFDGHPGRRVVEGQHVMQAASDVFLGWTQDEASGRHFPLRGERGVDHTMQTARSVRRVWALPGAAKLLVRASLLLVAAAVVATRRSFYPLAVLKWQVRR